MFSTKCGFRIFIDVKTNWIYLVALALYVQVTLGAAIMLRVISPFDPCSLYQLGFRGDIYLPWSVNCICREFELFILDTASAYLIGLSRPNVLTYRFVFFLQILLSLFLFFLCHNFLTFLGPASSDSTLVAIGYFFASITEASSALIPGLLWSLRCPVAI